MNEERLIEIAEWLEGGAKHAHATFNMKKGLVVTEKAWQEGDIAACGTSCCIAGAAVSFFSDDAAKSRLGNARTSFCGPNYDRIELGWITVSEEAARLLGLPYGLASILFTPPNFEGMNITPAWAARVVRKLVATGEVDWEGTHDEEHRPA